MKIISISRITTFVFMTAFFTVAETHAAIVISIQEEAIGDGGSVVNITSAGSIDINSLTFEGLSSFLDDSLLLGGVGRYGVSEAEHALYSSFSFSSSGLWPGSILTAWGTGTLAYDSNVLWLPVGYASGDDISLHVSNYYFGGTLDSAGLVEGSWARISWDGGAESITMIVGSIPEPTAALLLVLGLIPLALYRRRPYLVCTQFINQSERARG